MEGFQHGIQDPQPVIGAEGVQPGYRIDGLVSHRDCGVDVPGDRVGPGQVRQVQCPGPVVVRAQAVHGVVQQQHRPLGCARIAPSQGQLVAGDTLVGGEDSLVTEICPP
ncbi:MAG: hypothetical protein ACRDQZ_02975 [Mycobacteriales bacterium]